MAWPFTSVDAPNLNTGPGIAVPVGAPVSITASQAWLTGANFHNSHATNQIVVTLTDTAGSELDQFKISPGGRFPAEWAFRPTLGVKWGASLIGLKGHLWGYV